MSYEERLHLAQAELDGLAGDEGRRLLEDDPAGWVEALDGLLRLAERELAHLRATVHGPERRLVLEDFGGERDRISAALDRLRDRLDEGEDDTADDEDDERTGTGTAQLQLSWGEGVLIAWGGGDDVESDDLDTVRGRLSSLGAPAGGWDEHEPIPLPDGSHAAALSTRLTNVLGWLASLQTSAGQPFVGPSVTWMALVTALGVRLAARGRVVPQLTTDRGRGNGGRARARVSWSAGLVDRTQLRTLSRAMPGVVTVARQQRDPLLVTLSLLDATTDTICRQAAASVEVPAAPTRANSSSQLAEVVLAHLGGQELDGQTRDVQEMHKALRRWARTVMGEQHVRLVLEMDEPDEQDGGWELRTLASIGRGNLLPVEAAMSQANQTRRQRILRELERLERTYGKLRRGRIRGEVILNQNEAWQLMSVEGRKLLDQGFDVRVPLLQKRKARVGLRLTAVEEHRIADEGEKRSANDLHNVAWSVMLDDVEVDAEEIRRLAAESRPMVQSAGRWVEVDHADLQAAAEALEEREQHRSMTGADMLRYALGLEEAPLGDVSIAGQSWATQLLQAATAVPEDPDTELDGFDGELRIYQAHANAWLEFLDGAGLGGILALDMGLGKTPTVLAHLTTTRHRGPALAIVPPAVAGNWAREAERFVPDLEIVVHHGQRRAEVDELPRVAEKCDLLITTYGTALRDIEGLEQVRWGKVILDEAQVIKNHTSETAQQLRRLDAHGRIALTGTPIENGLGDLWALLDFCNPGLVGDRTAFMSQLGRDRSTGDGGPEEALRTLNGVLVFRRTKSEPAIAAELPERIDELDHCVMTKEQVGLYQAVLDDLVEKQASKADDRQGAVLAAITKLKQICNHPAAFTGDDGPLDDRSGKLERLHEILDNVFAAGERALIFTHFATWGDRLANHLAAHYGQRVDCYHGGLTRKQRDEMVARFQSLDEPGAMVLSLKAGGTGLNLTAASHVILYDRWWNPAVEDQARDRVWRIGQTRTVVAHRLVCPGTVDERVEEIVQGKRRIADMVLPRSSSVGDLDSAQLRAALGLDESMVLTEEA